MSAVIRIGKPASGMGFEHPSFEDLYRRALEEISEKLQSSMYFLNEYESLSVGSQLEDLTEADLCIKKSCFEQSIRSAYILADSFKFVFLGTPVHGQLKALSDWLFELNYGINLLASVPELKACIQVILDSVSNNQVLGPSSRITWGICLLIVSDSHRSDIKEVA